MAKRATPTNKRRKGLLSVVLPWLRRFGIAACILIAVAWVGAWIVLSGAGAKALDWSKQQIVTASGKAGFVVEDLLVEGRVHADASFLKALINVQKGDPLFSLSPSAAKKLLEETEWIKHAHVERRLPGTIYIRLTERIPSALWQEDNKLMLVDEDGKQIKTDRLERFENLIVISGEGARASMPMLLAYLKAEETVRARTRFARRIGGRRWDLKLDNGLVLNMPEDDNIGFALKRAAKAQETEGLFDMDGLEAVDLRFDDKMVLKTKPGTVQDYKKLNTSMGSAL